MALFIMIINNNRFFVLLFLLIFSPFLILINMHQRTRYPKHVHTRHSRTKKPFKWNPLYTEIIRRLTGQGRTQRQIAEALGVHVCTIEYWIRTKPKVREAIHKGNLECNEEVKRSLFELATGYSHEDTQFFMYKGQILQKQYIKHYPPSPFAAYKWLTIKDRENWTDTRRHESELTIRLTQQIDLTDFTDTELLALEKIGLKQLAENGTHRPN